MDHRPMQVKSAPQRRALGDQPQEQAEETYDENGEVPGAGPVARGMLVRITHRDGRGLLVLRCVLRVADAQRRVAEQMQGPEDPVAEE
jgi:hypothetical protein